MKRKSLISSVVITIQMLVLVAILTSTIFAYPVIYNTQGSYEGDTYGAYLWGFSYTPSFTYDSSTKVISSIRNAVINGSDCENAVWNGTPCKIEVTQSSKSFTSYVATYKFEVKQFCMGGIGWLYLMTSIITIKYYTTSLLSSRNLDEFSLQDELNIEREVISIESFIDPLQIKD